MKNVKCRIKVKTPLGVFENKLYYIKDIENCIMKNL